MNCSSFKTKLLKARTYAEAAPLLETMNLSPSAHQLAIWSYSLPSDQEALRQQGFMTIIQEAQKLREEEEEGKHGKMHEEEEEETHKKETKKMGMEEEEDEDEDDEHDDDEKKMHEYEGGKSVISSKPGMEHLDREDKPTENGAKPDTGFSGAQNQMKEALRRMGVPETTIKKIIKELERGPPMSYTQTLETISATVKSYMAPLIQEIQSLKKGYMALDKKYREALASQRGTMPLNIGDQPRIGGPRNKVAETEMGLGSMMPTRRTNLEDVRNEMSELNEAFYKKLITDKSQPYQ